MNTEIKYLELLSKTFKNIAETSTEIINLQAIMNLPKGTEHFMTDIHGEYEAFNHVLRNGSGTIRNKIEEAYGNTLTENDKKELASIIYYPKEKVELMQNKDNFNIDKWMITIIYRLIEVCKVVCSKYTRSKVRKAMTKDFEYILQELLYEKKELANKKEYFDSKRSETGMDVKYFGNPLVDKYVFSEKLGNEILLLPGSRKQEITKFFPEIIKLVKSEEMKNEKFIVKFADKSHLKYIEDIDLSKIENLEISFESISELRDRCKYAIATSGTVTFEVSLTGLPVIVVYRTSFINAFIARKILKIKYISLTNLNAKEEVFSELLQEDFTVDKLLIECKKMEENKEKIVLKLKEEREKLGNKGVLPKVASYLREIIK